jgi:hypothetical protein
MPRMNSPTLLSIVESAAHPNFTSSYQKLGINETKLNSMRKALASLKSQQFNFIVCEFFYGYGNNYAGVNISNLDAGSLTSVSVALACSALITSLIQRFSLSSISASG